MDYKEYKESNYSIDLIKTKKFKTIYFEIQLRSKLMSKESFYKREAIAQILRESSKNYKTKREILLKQEDLYNASGFSTYRRLGETYYFSMISEFLNPKLTEEDYFEDAISLTFELLFNPDVEDNHFNKKIVDRVKELLKTDYKRLDESPQNKSYFKALELMDDTSLTAINSYIEPSIIDTFDEYNLYEEYKKLINESTITISMIGDIDDKEVDIIKKYATFNDIKQIDSIDVITNKEKETPTIFSENSTFAQSQILYVLNTNTKNEYERKYLMGLLTDILGGGTLESKLNKTIREENSLCYGIYCDYFARDGIAVIHTSLDKQNIDKCKKLIDEILDNVNNITEEEFNNAISLRVNELIGLYDNQRFLLQNYYRQLNFNEDSLETMIEKTKNIKIEELINLKDRLKINTIYTLVGEKDE